MGKSKLCLAFPKLPAPNNGFARGIAPGTLEVGIYRRPSAGLFIFADWRTIIRISNMAGGNTIMQRVVRKEHSNKRDLLEDVRERKARNHAEVARIRSSGPEAERRALQKRDRRVFPGAKWYPGIEDDVDIAL